MRVAETEACEKLSTQFHRPVRNGQSQVTVSVPQVHISSPQNTFFDCQNEKMSSSSLATSSLQAMRGD